MKWEGFKTLKYSSKVVIYNLIKIEKENMTTNIQMIISSNEPILGNIPSESVRIEKY
jgi:hypothetical protein